MLSFFIEHGSYALMIGWLVAAGLGMPLPEDVAMIAGAVLAQRGLTDLGLTVAALAFGVFVGDSTLYFLARRLGPSIYKWKPIARVLPEKRREWIEAKIAKHGGLVVFFARHVAGFRGPTFAMAAIHGISYPRFILWDMLALAISLPVWMGLGWVFATSLDDLEAHQGQAQAGVFVAIAALLVVVIGGHFAVGAIQRRRQKRAEDELRAGGTKPDVKAPPPESTPSAP